MINTLNSLTEWQKIAKIWQIQLNLEYTKPEKNVRLSFKDIGAFTELTAINYLNGYTGSGSGGMGFDLINYEKHKAIEVKSCCTIQNSVCNNCGTKFNSLFLDKCPKCNLNNFKEMSDSRFGISAIEFLDQFEKGFFECFYLCYISLIEYNKETSKIDIQLEWFKIDFSNDKLKDIQLEYFITQKEKGKGHCNLLPYSFDFYKLAPTKISDIFVSFSISNLDDIPQIKEIQNNKPLRICIDKMHNQQERWLFEKLKTFDKQTQTADIVDFTLNIPYAKKNLGKLRGDTRAKVYQALK